MQGEPREIPEELDRWLNIATDALIISAEKQVRVEITEHVLSSINDFVAQGFDYGASTEKAIAALGGAKAAAKKFNMVYLTRSEEASLEFACKPGMWGGLLLLGVFAISMFLLIGASDSPIKLFTHALMCIGSGSGAILNFGILQNRLKSVCPADWLVFNQLVFSIWNSGMLGMLGITLLTDPRWGRWGDNPFDDSPLYFLISKLTYWFLVSAPVVLFVLSPLRIARKQNRIRNRARAYDNETKQLHP